ncbi:MAG: hypothetical protein HY211_05915 [Candidatus Omnitrophica bacterium]|nr:hypothetical protein [Candidatus Omnitrophota bacterium]
MEKRFKLLRIFGLIFKVIAWACLLLGIVGAVGVFVAGTAPQAPGAKVPPPAIAIAVVLAAWTLFFLIFYTVSELIKLLLTIEENSRKE